MSVSLRAVLVWFISALTLQAQGYAGLGTPAPGFANPDPDYVITFPKDDGAHPDFRAEWWYLTANLTDEAGAPLGAQWTLFRTVRAPGNGLGWTDNQLWMAHAAVTSTESHAFAERFARGGVGQAGVRADPFAAWLDDWRFAAPQGGDDAYRLQARTPDFAIDLTLTATGPVVLHGAKGYSVKSEGGQASHYFSRPQLTAAGTVEIDGTLHRVTGTAWLDREWSSQPLARYQLGWDWAGLSLDDGRHLMVARVRATDRTFHFGTLIDPTGHPTPLKDRQIAMTPADKGTPPMSWRIAVPDHDLALSIRALNPQAWTGTLFRYWEGPVTVTGTHGGRGYLEMTGTTP